MKYFAYNHLGAGCAVNNFTVHKLFIAKTETGGVRVKMGLDMKLLVVTIISSFVVTGCAHNELQRDASANETSQASESKYAETVDQKITEADTDGDGVLSESEFLSANATAENFTEEGFKRRFEFISQGDGEISREDLIALYEQSDRQSQ